MPPVYATFLGILCSSFYAIYLTPESQTNFLRYHNPTRVELRELIQAMFWPWLTRVIIHQASISSEPMLKVTSNFVIRVDYTCNTCLRAPLIWGGVGVATQRNTNTSWIKAQRSYCATLATPQTQMNEPEVHEGRSLPDHSHETFQNMTPQLDMLHYLLLLAPLVDQIRTDWLGVCSYRWPHLWTCQGISW